ncbi:MAG: zinc ribbon domain-containing protein [Armatimonadota bacterium]|jgi:hypothetical protein
MRCESCGKSVAKDAAFCSECGARATVRSARELVDLAQTSGLVRGAPIDDVPDPADIPEFPADVPEIPEAAPLPEAMGMALPTGEVAETDASVASSVGKARIREERRRAAQALVETAQTELREELAELAEREARIEAATRGDEIAHSRGGPPPPPPPPAFEERIWAETRERAEMHGLTAPRQAGASDPERESEQAGEDRNANCLTYGCIAVVVGLFLILLLQLILSVPQ